MVQSASHISKSSAASFFKTDAVWMFLDFAAIGDQETVIFQEVVDPQVWDMQSTSHSLCYTRDAI